MAVVVRHTWRLTTGKKFNTLLTLIFQTPAHRQNEPLCDALWPKLSYTSSFSSHQISYQSFKTPIGNLQYYERQFSVNTENKLKYGHNFLYLSKFVVRMPYFDSCCLPRASNMYSQWKTRICPQRGHCSLMRLCILSRNQSAINKNTRASVSIRLKPAREIE